MIGIDAVNIDRIKNSCDRFDERFLHRFLSFSEIKLCHKDDGKLNYQRVAGFWAAKEAISKALGSGIGEKLSFLDILLSKDSKGKPQATLTSNKLEMFNVQSIALSITHEQNLAIAIAWVKQN